MKFLYKEDLEMAIEKQYLSDVAAILSHRHDNGADLWATPDNKLLKGSPFSTFDSVLYLLELGMSPQEPVLKAAADLIFSAWQEDGRFRIYPTGGIYPCQTAIAANVLCHMGYAEDERLQKTFQHFLDIHFLSDMGKKPSIQIHNRHSMHLTHFVLVNISIMNLHWTELLNFCWSIGLFASQSAHATMELVRYLCRSNTHSETTICFNMYMSCLFMAMPKMTVVSLKPLRLSNLKRLREKL